MTTAIPVLDFAPSWTERTPRERIRQERTAVAAPATDRPRRGIARFLGAGALMASGGMSIVGAFLPWSELRGQGASFSMSSVAGLLPQAPAQVAVALGTLLTVSGLCSLIPRRLPTGVWVLALFLGIAVAVTGMNEITAIERGNNALGEALGGDGLLGLVQIGMRAGIGVHLQVWAGIAASVGALLCAVKPRRGDADPA